MKVVILSAGVGSRLRPLTNHLPKCLVKLYGKEILRYQIESFLQNGVEEVILITGYKGEMIEDFCNQNGFQKVTIIENRQYDTTNNMFSLNLAKKFVAGQEFLFCNGDVIYGGDIIQQLLKADADNLIGVQAGNYNDESMKITLGTNGVINNISKQIERDDAYGTSIDLYRISANGSVKLFETIEAMLQQNVNNWTEVALQHMMQQNLIDFKPLDIGSNNWYEIDNLEDYFNAVKMFAPFSIFKKKKAFFDLDGTVYLGNQLMPKAEAFFKQLHHHGVEYFFLSNNTSKTKSEYVQRINAMGIACTEANIILPVDAVIQHLHDEKITDIYLVGNNKLAAFFEQNDINVRSDNPQYVVVAFDTDVTYEKLQKASIFIQKGVPYIVTNIDMVCPTENGYIPDTGALGQLIQTTTGIKPVKVFGKPLPSMIEAYIKDCTPDEVVIMGDRTYTDMAMAEAINCDFILTLTGEAKAEDLINIRYHKCMVVNSIGELLN